MSRPYRIADCIRANQVIMATCRTCRRRAYYLPEDLQARIPEMQDVSMIRFRCSQCNSGDVAIRPHAIDERDHGKLLVMRPVGKRTVWKAVRLQ